MNITVISPKDRLKTEEILLSILSKRLVNGKNERKEEVSPKNMQGSDKV